VLLEAFSQLEVVMVPMISTFSQEQAGKCVHEVQLPRFCLVMMAVPYYYC
jgi:hypothetical protein